HPTPPPATPTLSLHDALPIYSPCADSSRRTIAASGSSDTSSSTDGSTTSFSRYNGNTVRRQTNHASGPRAMVSSRDLPRACDGRSEEHTSELQSRFDLVCRLL